MQSKLKCALLLGAAFSLTVLPVFANVDWNWPGGMIPSDPKEIDKATTAYASGDVDGAITILNNLKARQGDDCRVRHILIDIYKEQRRYSEAKSELADLSTVESRFISKNPMNYPGWMDPQQLKVELGTISMAEGNHQEALNSFREATQMKGSNPHEAKKYMGMCYEQMGDHEQAMSTYKSALEAGGSSFNAGDKAFFVQAIARLDKSNSGGGGGEQTQGHSQGQQPVQGSEQPEQGGRPSGFGSSSVSTRIPGAGGPPRAITPTVMGTGPLQDAANEISSRKYDAAIARLKPIAEKAPANAQAHYLLAVAYASTGKYELARKEYEATLKYAQEMKLLKLATSGLQKIQGKQ